jgi:hypothetical protein
MNDHFRRLAERNLRNLKWKHHPFLCLGAEMAFPTWARCAAAAAKSSGYAIRTDPAEEPT